MSGAAVVPPRRFSWLPKIGVEHLRAEQNPRYFLQAHLPVVVGAAALFYVPAVRRISGVEPVALSALLGVHLLSYGASLLLGSRVESDGLRSGYSLWVSTVNVFATAGAAMLCGDPASPLWATYFVYPYVAARAFGATVYLTVLLVVAPTLAGLLWSVEGRAPPGHGFVLLAGLGLAAAVAYLLLAKLLASVGAAQRRLAEQELQASSERERGEISRRLLETLGSRLEQIARRQREALDGEGPAAEAALRAAREEARAALDELRLTVSTLQGEAGSALGLEALLRRRLERICQAQQVTLELALHGEPREPSPVHIYRLARIVDEAAANALWHGRPSSLRVHLQLAPELHLEVEDDGAGFDPALAPPGRGLASMREHAEALQARLEVISWPERGTRVVVRPASPVPRGVS